MCSFHKFQNFTDNFQFITEQNMLPLLDELFRRWNDAMVTKGNDTYFKAKEILLLVEDLRQPLLLYGKSTEMTAEFFM